MSVDISEDVESGLEDTKQNLENEKFSLTEKSEVRVVKTF